MYTSVGVFLEIIIIIINCIKRPYGSGLMRHAQKTSPCYMIHAASVTTTKTSWVSKGGLNFTLLSEVYSWLEACLHRFMFCANDHE